jgi:hypothetical protein
MGGWQILPVTGPLLNMSDKKASGDSEGMFQLVLERR